LSNTERFDCRQMLLRSVSYLLMKNCLAISSWPLFEKNPERLTLL